MSAIVEIFAEAFSECRRALAEAWELSVGRASSHSRHAGLEGGAGAPDGYGETGVLDLESLRKLADEARPIRRELPAGLKILAVDDDSNILAVLEMVFGAYDCEFRKARSAKNALAAALHSAPDAILLDFHMPHVNGYELMMQLRKHEALSRVPIVLLTGTGRIEKLEESLIWESKAVLRKPARKDDIVAAVETALGGRLPKKAPKEAGPSDWETDVQAQGPQSPLPSPASNSAAGAARAENGLRAEAPIVLPEIKPRIEETARPRAAQSIEHLVSRGSEALKLVDPSALEPSTGSVHAPSAEDDAPIIRLVDGVIGQAVEKKASDIHIEPQEKHISVRFRIDGELVPILDIPIAIAGAVAARIKIMSNLDISERRVPQDGRFAIQWEEGRKLDFRVSTLPSKYGEKIVMRILGQMKIKGDLGALKLSQSDTDAVRRALSSPNGLILMTGPTGSGKTTSLYTMIATLNTKNRNIVTAEDPVEFDLPGITQVAINKDVGLTFEAALRAFLRQDPDIMLVGEIRDGETAEIAMKASITGHLVLSTVHTNDAASTISRLVDMGIPAYLVVAALRLVMAQRLVRLLCPHCKVPSEVSEQDRAFLSVDELRGLSRVWRGVGCDKCNGIGYSGRRPVIEVLPLRTAAMRELVLQNGSTDAVRGLARREGMRTLREHALDLVARGETSLQEALKIVVAD